MLRNSSQCSGTAVSCSPKTSRYSMPAAYIIEYDSTLYRLQPEKYWKRQVLSMESNVVSIIGGVVFTKIMFPVCCRETNSVVRLWNRVK